MNPPPLPNDTILLGQQLVIYAQSHRIRKDTWLNALDTFQDWYPQTKPASADDALQHRLAKNRSGALVPAFERLIGAIQHRQRQHQGDEHQDTGQDEDKDEGRTGDTNLEHQENEHRHDTDEEEQETGNRTQGKDKEDTASESPPVRDQGTDKTHARNAALPYMSPMAYIWHKNPLYAFLRTCSVHDA
jgi:hypothetical protein